MQLKDIISGNVITIGPNEPVSTAAQRMREANVGCVVVTGSAVLGIVTDRDLAIRCLASVHDASQCTVSRHMSAPVITAVPTMDVLDAAHLMVEQRVKRLPVVEADELRGIVSLSDIAQALDRPLHDLMVGMGPARR